MAPLLTDPFAHLHVTELFSPRYYDQILANWPASEEFESRAPMATLFFKAPAEPGWKVVGPSPFWSDFRSNALEGRIIPAVARKFGFDPRSGCCAALASAPIRKMG